MSTNVYTIPSWNFPEVRKLVDSLNRKAAKRSLPELTLKILGTKQIDDPRIDVQFRREMGLPIPQIEVTELELSGGAYKIAGWTFVGTLDHATMRKALVFKDPAETLPAVMVQAVPGQVVPQYYFTADQKCDHCTHKRYRNETFILRNEAGEHKQVGRQCLQEFFGIDAHELVLQLTAINKFTAAMGDSDEERFFGGMREPIFALNDILAWSHSCILKAGWVSKKSAEDSMGEKKATANLVEYLFDPPRGGPARAHWQKQYDRFKPSEADYAAATATREYFKAQPYDTEYLNNIHVLNRADVCPFKFFGYACSMPAGYIRHLNALAEAKARAEAAGINDNYVGTKGEKITLEILVSNARTMPGFEGRKAVELITVQDKEAHTLVWWNSGEVGLLERGKRYEIKGTVKDHKTFQNLKQTVLTRVSVLREIPA